MSKSAVIFGAGNIGRGFIGQLFVESEIGQNKAVTVRPVGIARVHVHLIEVENGQRVHAGSAV